MFENPRRGRQARNFTTNVPKLLDLKSSSEQIFSRKLTLGAPDKTNCFSAISEMRWQKLFYFKFHSYFETYGLKIHRISWSTQRQQKQSILWKLLLVCALRPSVNEKNSYTILLTHNQTNC